MSRLRLREVNVLLVQGVGPWSEVGEGPHAEDGSGQGPCEYREAEPLGDLAVVVGR